MPVYAMSVTEKQVSLIANHVFGNVQHASMIQPYAQNVVVIELASLNVLAPRVTTKPHHNKTTAWHVAFGA